MDASSNKNVTRRDFMKAAIVSIGGLIGAAVGLPAIAYIVGPALKQTTEAWIRLGSINKIELNNPTLFKTTVDTQTGWISTQEEISAYVLTENGDEFVRDLQYMHTPGLPGALDRRRRKILLSLS